MSVIVKGMALPKNCDECIVNCDVFTFTDKRSPDCPLIELPPHGRLVDIKSVEDLKSVAVYEDYQEGWNDALDTVVENAPTVIEAEGSET